MIIVLSKWIELRLPQMGPLKTRVDARVSEKILIFNILHNFTLPLPPLTLALLKLGSRSRFRRLAK
jgi:hypothetical protein